MSSSKTSATKSDNFTNSIIKSTERMAKWFFGEFIPKASKVIWKGCSIAGEWITVKQEETANASFSPNNRKAIVTAWSILVLIVGILLWTVFWKLFTP